MPTRCPENLDEARTAARTKQVIFTARDGAHVVCSGGIDRFDLEALERAEHVGFTTTHNYAKAAWSLWATWCRLRRELFLGVKLLRGHVAEIVLQTPETMPRDLVERIGALLEVAASGEWECDRRSARAIVPRRTAERVAMLIRSLLDADRDPHRGHAATPRRTRT